LDPALHENQWFDRLVHRPEGEIFYDPNYPEEPVRIPGIPDGGTHQVTEGFIYRPDGRLVQNKRRAVVDVTDLKIAAGQKLQLKGFWEIVIDA
jgi:hypothetical protein